MYELTGPCLLGPDGMMRRGVIVRHLVLPGCRKDSLRVLDTVAETVPVAGVRLSLMAQYTPDFLPSVSLPDPYRSIRRKVTSYEYGTVAEAAARLGFEGWMQERSSATSRFTPDF
jgi:putative pyruvate formate lyase activating enzyme